MFGHYQRGFSEVLFYAFCNVEREEKKYINVKKT